MQTHSNTPLGLTSGEAARLLAQGHGNTMPKAKDGGVGEILRRNVLTLFNLLNAALAVVLALVGSYRNMMFLGVVISNMLIGTVQELRAKRTHDRLKLLSENPVKTLRDGVETDIAPGQLVLGDVVILNRGDQVPADAKVLSGDAQADESLLTGESVAVAKAVGDTLYSGSFLTQGTVTAELTAVGANSYAGRLQLSARKVKRATSELMRDMKKIIKVVSIAILPIGAALFLKQYYVLDISISEAVTKTVASMLGMIPEGLMLLTSIALAAGVVKLGKRKALVNELYGIESLARTSVVCMDKTGTLTGGSMQVAQAVAPGAVDEHALNACMGAMVATFQDETPTNDALRAAYGSFAPTEPPAKTVPFSSERKWSAARFNGLGSIVLGAPERLLTGEWRELANEHAAKGLRVLALVRSEQPLVGEELPQDLSPVALVCLSDTLRPNVQKTVRYFGEQGVMLKVISGDSPLTVSRVAQDAGIPNAERMVDLSALGASPDYATLAKEYTVFGRVSPDDKRMLIQALRKQGHGVAMVGDGVNDIPALKVADCSIAMAGGSDAAYRVSQLTLLDADFDIMPEIVLEGRRVINNITRASSLFLVKNIFSFLLSVALLALPFVYPFSPIQLTLVSGLTIGLPSFVLALQPSRERVKGRFLRNVIMRALPGGLSVAVLTIALMLVGRALSLSAEQVSTLCTILAGYSGIVVLLLTCLPLNFLRSALVCGMAASFAAAVLLLPNVFYLTAISGKQWWTLAGQLVLVPALQIGLGALIRGKKPATPAAGATVQG